ncbi:MAG: Hpt domain-containing protein [Thermoleophilia bacterium]|nr:Hpt domain-containing protein [Thermoleophilia bacterium]MDH3725682.1 Hpt domain-containing protein [Thermoleophilia bacterium]
MALGTIDPQALERVRQVGGDQLVADLVQLGLDSIRARAAAARDAVGRGDAAEVRREAHALRSSAANVGAVRLARLAEQVELHADARAELHELVDDLVVESATVERALRETHP